MKLIFVALFVAFAAADFYDDGATDNCLMTNDAAECFRTYAGCRKNSTSIGARRGCLYAFDKCIAGDCPGQCREDHRDCMHKNGTNVQGIMRCHGLKGVCQKACLTVINE